MNFQKIKNFLNRKFSTNLFLSICYRILIVYLLYSFSRVVFYIYNIEHFGNLPFSRLFIIFSGGLNFDTTAIIYTNLLFLLGYLLPFKFRHNRKYQTVLKYIFLITNGIGLLANFSDVPYFDFTLERTNIGVFDQFKNESNLGALFLKFIVDYWYISILYILTLLVMNYLYNRVVISEPKPKKAIFYYPLALVVLAGSIAICIGGIRGGFKHSTRPIAMSNAGEYVRAPIETAVVLNTPFCIIRSSEAPGYKRVEYFTNEKELDSIYTPVQMADTSRIRRPDNVVIFIIESFNKEFIGSLNKGLDNGNYKGYTPFIDSLLPYCKTFKYSFANGRKSIEALPSVLTSIPSIESPFILTPYFKNNLSSLPILLREKGYKSALFHGAPNGSMGFQAFGQIIGMDEYYGKDEFNNDNEFDGMWGIWDEEFFQFYANTIDTFSKPFVTALFSVTSHHPFNLPKRYSGRFKDNDFPLQKCIEYTDYSLERFFATASKMKWFKNTLFIITADHVSLNQRPEFKNELGYFSVPIILYKPGSDLRGIDTVTIAQQIDILPTILDYLGYDKDYITFGQSLLNPGSNKFAINYINGTYRIYKGDYMLMFDGRKTVGLFNMKTDPMITRNISEEEPKVRDSLEKLTKAFIQQYKNRMIENRLVVVNGK